MSLDNKHNTDFIMYTYNATYLQMARISLQGREIDYITKITVEMSVCLISNFEKCLISTHIHVIPPSSALL